MEFDAAGNYVQGWGGEGEGFEWPADEHTIHVDHKDNVWISSAGGPRMGTRKENQILKFSRAGRFLLQVGRRGMSQGSLDTKNFNNAADIFVYAEDQRSVRRRRLPEPPHHRAGRRHRGVQADVGRLRQRAGRRRAEPARRTRGPGPQQFNLVHGVRVSDDGLVYVADRRNNRVQVFTLDGTFQREIFVERKTKLLGTSFSIAFSRDPAQQFLFLADAGNGKVRIFDRRTLEEVGSIGRIGRYAGQFVFLHNVAVDSAGNLYTAEVGGGRRVQKFLLTR